MRTRPPSRRTGQKQNKVWLSNQTSEKSMHCGGSKCSVAWASFWGRYCDYRISKATLRWGSWRCPTVRLLPRSTWRHSPDHARASTGDGCGYTFEGRCQRSVPVAKVMQTTLTAPVDLPLEGPHMRLSIPAGVTVCNERLSLATMSVIAQERLNAGLDGLGRPWWLHRGAFPRTVRQTMLHDSFQDG